MKMNSITLSSARILLLKRPCRLQQPITGTAKVASASYTVGHTERHTAGYVCKCQNIVPERFQVAVWISIWTVGLCFGLV